MLRLKKVHKRFVQKLSLNKQKLADFNYRSLWRTRKRSSLVVTYF